jgi:hypothetical protein
VSGNLQPSKRSIFASLREAGQSHHLKNAVFSIVKRVLRIGKNLAEKVSLLAAWPQESGRTGKSVQNQKFRKNAASLYPICTCSQIALSKISPELPEEIHGPPKNS